MKPSAEIQEFRVTRLEAICIELLIALKIIPEQSGVEKKALLELAQRTAVDAMIRYGVRLQLDPQVKHLRPAIIDDAVHSANFLGMLKTSSNGKRLLAAAALGYVPLRVMAVYRRVQDGEPVSDSDQLLLSESIATLGTVRKVERPNVAALAKKKRGKR